MVIPKVTCPTVAVPAGRKSLSLSTAAALAAITLFGSPSFGQQDPPSTWAPPKPVKIAQTLNWGAPGIGKQYANFYARVSKHSGRIVYLDVSLVPRSRAPIEKISIKVVTTGTAKKCVWGSEGILNSNSDVLFSINAPNDNHSMLNIHVRKKVEYPFQMILCRYPSTGLQISGLFLVARSSIATANLIELYPVRFSDIR